uniref:Glutaredoxin domain-containing protein n=1 Tax=Odontella aurita TaxID=265563 RepID=A0A7S4NGB9_9STRA|mmetsp:Transcript_63130/g.186550  ORF Transcript_63130/g.186550 Transcript_63130/m.186550 type:complete len:240 (+) Transcript_63130:254-973(+)
MVSMATASAVQTAVLVLLLAGFSAHAFVHPSSTSASSMALTPRIRSLGETTRSVSRLNEMKRPFLDQVASTLFRLEQDRVESSSVVDDNGRVGEPMEWSESGSMANKLSELMAGPGYAFKQFVADVVAGEFDETDIEAQVDEFVDGTDIAMFSFSTCPFCRRAKDYLSESGIQYESMELDELEGNTGNEIRAVLGRKTRRTSVPAIFIRGQFIGGCNDGPGLLTLAESGELDRFLGRAN